MKRVKLGSTDVPVKLRVEKRVMKNVRVFDSSKQIGSNACKTNNGNCEQLCLFDGKQAVCKCAHSELVANGKCKRKLLFFIKFFKNKIESSFELLEYLSL